VEEIAEELGWVVQKSEGAGDWDVWWTDREIEPNTLFRMNLHQKINHFPGIYILARKNLFGLGLMSMREHFPEEYNFFPETWTIPLQFSQFRHYYESVEKGKARTYIVKPEALSQGRGIFLTRNI
jgi:tubulin polyglutamylase TTLL6/13